VLATVIVAVTEVADFAVMIPVIPAFAEVTAVAPARPVPEKVSVNEAAPAAADGTLSAVSVVAGSTVKPTLYADPLTIRPSWVGPVAAAALIVMDATTEVADVELIVPLTPALGEYTAVAPARPVPVKVTLKFVPATPVTGLTDVSVTAGLTVNGTV
jgi:hypothetical protein